MRAMRCGGPDVGKAAKLKFSKTHSGEKQRQLNLKVEAWACVGRRRGIA